MEPNENKWKQMENGKMEKMEKMEINGNKWQ